MRLRTHPAIIVLLLWAGLAHAQGPAKRVWIDTDPAIGSPIREVDDAFALLLAFRSSELKIDGISTTYGNAPVRQTTRVAQRLVAEFGRGASLTNDDLFVGAASRNDLGRTTSASMALAAALAKGRLTYIALGPLTNLATFIQRCPALASRIDEVIAVGGVSDRSRLKFGRLHIHDANIFKDPHSARVLLESKLPILLVPIETFSATALTDADLQQLRGTGPAGNFLYRNTRTWWWFWRSIVGLRAAPVFDASAVLTAARSELAVIEERMVVVDSQGVLRPAERRGRTVRWCNAIRPSAKRLLLRRLSTLPR